MAALGWGNYLASSALTKSISVFKMRDYGHWHLKALEHFHRERGDNNNLDIVGLSEDLLFEE